MAMQETRGVSIAKWEGGKVSSYVVFLMENILKSVLDEPQVYAAVITAIFGILFLIEPKRSK